MQLTQRVLSSQKQIALVAHDNLKSYLLDWCRQHRQQLAKHSLCATGTTGTLINQQLGLNVTAMLSGPMGGDQQLGAMIATGKIDILIFFWDPLNAVPHDPDVKALLRLATVWNIPVATNRATADVIIQSASLDQPLTIDVPDYQLYLQQRTQD